MKKAKRPLAVLTALLLTLAVIGGAPAVSAVTLSEVLETTYSIDQILFGDEEINGFTFVYFDKADSTIKDMIYLPIGESPWNELLDMYTGPTAEGECEGYEYIIFNYTYGVPTVHPSMKGNTGCAFTAPYTGTIKIMTYFRVGSVVPTSCELFIYKNEVSEETLLFRQVGTEDAAASEYEVTVDVTAGDKIYWFIDAMEDNTDDSCDFNPRVQYTAVNDENVSSDPVVTDPPAASEEQTGQTTEPPATGKPDTEEPDTEEPVTSAMSESASSSEPSDSGKAFPVVPVVIGGIILCAVVVFVVIKVIKKK